MKINLNNYRDLRVTDLEKFVTNFWKYQPLCIQKLALIESAIKQGKLNHLK